MKYLLLFQFYNMCPFLVHTAGKHTMPSKPFKCEMGQNGPKYRTREPLRKTKPNSKSHKDETDGFGVSSSSKVQTKGDRSRAEEGGGGKSGTEGNGFIGCCSSRAGWTVRLWFRVKLPGYQSQGTSKSNRICPIKLPEPKIWGAGACFSRSRTWNEAIARKILRAYWGNSSRTDQDKL